MTSFFREGLDPLGFEPHEHHAPELERRLLRQSVDEMSRRRWTCSTCSRSPVVGEKLVVFSKDGQERAVCELCVVAVADGTFGKPIRIERVHAGVRRLKIRRAA